MSYFMERLRTAAREPPLLDANGSDEALGTSMHSLTRDPHALAERLDQGSPSASPAVTPVMNRGQPSYVAHTAPVAIEALQLEGEHLKNDPDWPQGRCWLAAYFRMHDDLIEKAKEINTERSTSRSQASRARGEQDQSISSSIKLLRKEVFSLCPMKYLISGICTSFVLTIFSFVAPMISGRLVDKAVDTYNYLDDHPDEAESYDVWGQIYPSLTIYACLLLGSYTCEVLVGIFFAICGHTTVTRLRIKLFRNLTTQEIAFYDNHVSGELSSRLINDSAALSQLTQFTTQTFLGAMVKFVGSLIAMFLTHPRLAIIATIVTPLNMILVRKTGRTVGYYGVVQNDAMAKANSVAVEVLGSIRTVQSNVGEQMEGHRFMDKLNYYLRVIKATVYVETVLRFTNYGLTRARDVIIMGYGMHQVANGQISIGSWTAFFQYVALYSDGFQNLAEIWLNFKQTITSTGKFVQLLLREADIKPYGGDCPETCEGSICLENVTFAYASRPDTEVLKGINIKAVPGTVIALVGESGAGKSTVGRMLQRFYDPQGGQITLDGRDFKTLNLRWLRSQIGVVEQEPVLFDRTIKDNVAYGSAESRTINDVEVAAKLANAHDFIMKLENAYQTHPGERASRISGGQKQRVAIARAIVRSPKVLLLDEATSALDSENEHIVQEALDALMQGKTTFVIAHRLSTVVRATSILVMDQGRVIEQGSHEELLEDENSKYASFMKHQLVAPLLE